MPLILELASRQKGLNFKPGDEFFYTNTNYALAAMIVERISGVSLQQFTDERLFQPLGAQAIRAGVRISAPSFRGGGPPPMRRPKPASSPTCPSPMCTETAGC